jgi:hypothetical protein
MHNGLKVLPFRLQDSPASFATVVLGTTWKDPVTGFVYQIVKNTGGTLSPGMVVTKESTDGTFEVDEAALAERIYGIVVNELTGTTVTANDAFWVMRQGVAYALKSASGTAIVALGPVRGSAGYVKGFTGHVHSYSAAALGSAWNVQALVAKTANVIAGTQVMVRIT